jgi:hypothetical protein
MDFIAAHSTELASLGVALYTVINITVGLTPTPEDDKLWGKIKGYFGFISFLVPKDADGTLKLPFTSTKK